MTIFTVEFNVQTSNRAEYRRFIDDLCRRLGVDANLSHGRPILRPQEATPTGFFEIELQTNHHRVRFLFRPDNLYLVAYQMENSNTWLEFSTEGQQEHLIENSTFLDMDGCYGGARGLESRQTQGRNPRTRGETSLGQDCLMQAVNVLADSNDQRRRAQSLLVVIQMTSESMRFEDITAFIVSVYYPHDGRSRRPDDRLLELENSWGRISNALLRRDAHPDLNIFPLRYGQNGAILLTALEAFHSIRIILRNIYGISHPPPPKRLVGMGAVDPPLTLKSKSEGETYVDHSTYDNEDKAQGRRLLEIFSVNIAIDGEDTGNIYGKITVTDGLMSQNIYNRDKKDAEPIRFDQSIVLTGPATQSLSALDNFIININLREASYMRREVSMGEIAWNVFDPKNIGYTIDDAPQDRTIYGSKSTSAAITYAVFSNAVQATVEVKMINGDGEDPADVYGTISAGNTRRSFKDYGSVLFKVTNGNVKIRPGELIPLSRSIVAVPLDSDLVISADLYDHDTFSSDDQIAKGNVRFPAQLSGTSKELPIKGKYGEIKVKVTWAP